MNTVPAFMVNYPGGEAEGFLAEDDPLTLTINNGWAVLTDQAGPCLAFSATSGATITRVDPPQDEPTQE